MKKLYRIFLPVIICFFCFSVTVSAGEYDSYDFTYRNVIDDAELIENDKELNDRLEKISDKYDSDIVIVTVDSLGFKTSQEFADDFYDYNNYDENGILFLISTEERDWAISTKGDCIKIFNDNTQDSLISKMKSSLGRDDFKTAFDIFADECENTFKSYSTKRIIIPIGIAVVVGLIAALIGTLILKSQLTSVAFSKNAGSYLQSGSKQITQNQNIFLYKTISKTRKESSSSGSGGSSTHTSSSGSTHGGSSGKF